MTLTLSGLRPPADPDRFRIQVGRYGDRWYHDPLPADDTWPADDEQYPSMSLVKNAWPKFLNKWIADSVAQRAIDDWDNLARLDTTARFAVLAGAATSKRAEAAERGSRIHQLLERLALGLPLDEVWDANVAPFIPVAQSLINDLQPEWLFSEAVVISRTHRFGGTGDAGWRLRGKNYMVDFKTRLKHQAYDDEGVQVAGYAAGDYMIVDDNGVPARRPMPTFAGGLIITITPDSYELHPVDLTIGLDAFVALRRFWDVQQARNIVGKPIYIAGHGATDDAGLRAEHAYQRAKALADADAPIIWPSGVPTFREARDTGHTFTHDELLAIEAALSRAEKMVEAPFPPADPRANPERVNVMIERLKALPSDLLIVVEAETSKAKINLNATGGVSVRDLDALEQVVTPLEAEAARRAQSAVELLGDLAEDPVLAQALVVLTGASDIGHLTEAHLQRLEAIVGAVDDLVLAPLLSEDGVWTFGPGPKAEEILLSIGGNKGRPGALAAIKSVADEHALSRPRTFAIALDEPLLIALACHSAAVAA